MSDDEQPNEIIEAAKDAKARKARSTGNGVPLKAIGIGIGSAAVAAAVLYATRERAKRDR